MTILVPSTGPASWRAFLADEKHWKTGYSAKSLAYCWSEAEGLPTEIAAALDTSPLFTPRELLLAIPEHKVSLAGGGEHRRRTCGSCSARPPRWPPSPSRGR